MSEFRLAREIVQRSNAATWDQAKLEWDLEEVYRQDVSSECLCGHFPINEICVIHNRCNARRAEVGNVCVKKFLGLPSDRIFQAIGRIAENSAKPLNADAIDHAHRRGWIND